MRLLGLDIGTARTGVAVSDELGLTARPLETVPTGELTNRLPELLKEYGTDTIIVGRPRSLDGSLGQQVAVTERIIDHLGAAVDARFIFEDESATTPEGGDDAAAACVMLQGYLTEHQ